MYSLRFPSTSATATGRNVSPGAAIRFSRAHSSESSSNPISRTSGDSPCQCESTPPRAPMSTMTNGSFAKVPTEIKCLAAIIDNLGRVPCYPNPNSGQRGRSNLSIALAISQYAQIPSLQTVRIEIGMLGALVRVATLHQQSVFQLVADAVQLVRELQELAIAAGVALHLVLVVPDMHVQLRQGDDDSKQVGRCLDAALSR